MLCLLCNIPLRNAHCTIAIFEWNLLSGVLALRKVAELSQRHKNRYTIRMFSEGLLGFEPIQGATPFYDTDMMDLPLIELREAAGCARAVPTLAAGGHVWASLGRC